MLVVKLAIASKRQMQFKFLTTLTCSFSSTMTVTSGAGLAIKDLLLPSEPYVSEFRNIDERADNAKSRQITLKASITLGCRPSRLSL